MASDQESAAFRQLKIFDHLVEAGQWERVIALAPQILCDDPDNVHIHNMLTIAGLEVEDYPLARHHSDQSIRLAPEDALSHRLRARYLRAINRPLLAKSSILQALSIDPEDASVWAEYGWNCYERGDLHTARHACETARSLAPENLNTELLETAIEGAIDDPNRLSAFDQIEAYQKSLRLDPECAATHFNIGTTYLHQLDDGKNAAAWLRKAAALEPKNRDFQRELQKAICRCDPVLKIINSPLHLIKRCGWYVENLRAKHPYGIILALPVLIPLCFAGLILGGLWSVFLYLPSLLYRYLFWSEIIQKATGSERPETATNRPSFLFRLILFFGISISYWYLVYRFLSEPLWKENADMLIGRVMIIGMIIGIWRSARKRA
ncbi:MAG: tetratricopeptide repeat protein [Verrucomicrobiales bacterium]|nr:tetratricopeptide repeat protein [Verrucomicrobiales bacterium]